MNNDTATLAVMDPPALPAVRVEPALALSLLPVPEMQAMLAEYDARRKSFRSWLLSQLVQGVHYGVVPGTEPKMRNGEYVDYAGKVIRRDQWRPEKPSLYKAGADFLCDLMMIDPSFDPDIDAWKMLGAREGMVVIRCRLLSRGNSPFFPGRPKGEIIGEGRGAGEAGQKKRDGNAALKIAQKSAKVDAVIHALGISDLFTQDLEEQPPEPNPAPPADPTAPKVAPRAERAAEGAGGPRVTQDMLTNLVEGWRSRVPEPHTREAFCAWIKDQLQLDCEAATLGKVSGWSLDLVEAARQAIHEQRGGRA